MMREVAAQEAGNFRGVCPILNRATYITVHFAGWACALLCVEALCLAPVKPYVWFSRFFAGKKSKHTAQWIERKGVSKQKNY